MRILVVGGGTAGLIAASILKKRFGSYTVDLVKSDNIGIIGVGEGSTQEFKDYCDYIGIPLHLVPVETDGTLKVGIEFDGWNTRKFWHGVDADWNHSFGQYRYLYARQIAHNDHEMTTKFIHDGYFNSQFVNDTSNHTANQFHFDTHKLNEFLTKKVCKKHLGIKIYTDDIKEVLLNDKGEIDTIIGDRRDYDYDFYVDATGFKRLLIDKLGATWESYSDYLKVNAAVTFQTPAMENFATHTLAKAMDYGWRFRIPTYHRTGNGYVFDSNSITADQAKEELDKEFGRDIEIGRQFNFDPGRLKDAWIKNCVAVGLSSSFVEPLEATSIGSSIQQMFLLAHYLSDRYDQKAIDAYNRGFDGIMNNLRDFIVLHYLTRKTKTSFWKEAANVPLPDTLAEKLEIFKYNLPIDENFVDYECRYLMFKAQNYILVMEGLDLFDRKSIKHQFEALSPDLQEKAHNDIEFLKAYNPHKVSHRKFIEIHRELYST